MVGLDDESSNAVFGECKFWKGPVGANVLHDLERKAELVPWRKDERISWFVLFSIGGFTDELRAIASARDDVLLLDDAAWDRVATSSSVHAS